MPYDRVGVVYPKVTSPSFLLSARREILKEVIAEATSPAFASASIGVNVFCWERDFMQNLVSTLYLCMSSRITY